jgi:hypothetical protein
MEVEALSCEVTIPPSREKSGRVGHPNGTCVFLEGGVEVEDVGYLEADSVYQYQVSTYEYMPIARIWRRKHHLQLWWTGLHSAPKAGRQGTVYDQLTLEPGRQAITFGEPGRKMAVVGAVPAVDVAITIFIVAAAVTIAVFSGFMTVVLIAIVPAIVVIAVVFVVTVALCHSHAGGKRKGHGCNCAGAEPEL